MKSLGSIFHSLMPYETLFPNDSQCKKCGLFDTSRDDVMAVIIERQEKWPKRSITVQQARCKCGDPDEPRPRYSE